ncbi:preprotein translocase subunit SecE [Candidatus Omnitrophota bacterium]
MITRIRKFFAEVVVELKKVSWPTKPEVLASTWVVISTTFLLTAYIGSVDFALSKVLRILVK